MEQKDWLEQHEVEAYVGNNSYYYLHNWKEHRADKVKGVNIAALFFPTQWLGYRKMYAQSVLSYLFMFLVYLLDIGISVLLNISPLSFDVIYPFFSFLFAKILLGIFFAMYGNGMYRRKILICTQEYTRFEDNDKYISHLRKKGGTNVFISILFTLFELWLFISSFNAMYSAMHYTVQFANF